MWGQYTNVTAFWFINFNLINLRYCISLSFFFQFSFSFLNVGKNENAFWFWSWFLMRFNTCTRFFGFLTEYAIHLFFPQGKLLKSSLEESLKNLEIVKSRCHSCLEYSEKEEEELSWEAWQFARKKLVLSCEPQAPTGMHHLLRINRSWMCKIFAFFRNLISSISSSKLGYSLKRGGSAFSIFTCLFHPSYKVKKFNS